MHDLVSQAKQQPYRADFVCTMYPRLVVADKAGVAGVARQLVAAGYVPANLAVACGKSWIDITTAGRSIKRAKRGRLVG